MSSPSDQQAAGAALHVFTNDAVWVVAHDENDARIGYREHTGAHLSDDELEFERLQESKPLTLTFPGVGTVTKTCGEWARESGRGFLAATEG